MLLKEGIVLERLFDYFFELDRQLDDFVNDLSLIQNIFDFLFSLDLLPVRLRHVDLLQEPQSLLFHVARKLLRKRR